MEAVSIVTRPKLSMLPLEGGEADLRGEGGEANLRGDGGEAGLRGDGGEADPLQPLQALDLLPEEARVLQPLLLGGTE